jgi:protease-4
MKPVIISFCDVAASGGYYVATAGRQVLTNPSTLTGSIGVIGGKFNIKNLLSKIGVAADSVEKGKRSGYASATRPFSESEARLVRTQMNDFYENLFLPKVAASRNRNIGEVRRLAEGRIWTGAQAHSRGLVDAIGGLDEALAIAKELTGLEERKSRLVTYAQRRSLVDLLPLQLGQSLPTDRVLALMPEDFLID